MALTLKDYLDRPLDDYCSEILSEWRNNCINQTSFDIPIASRWFTVARSIAVACGYVIYCTVYRTKWFAMSFRVYLPELYSVCVP